MSGISKANSSNHLDNTTLTVVDTFGESFSRDDEESGLTPNIANASTASLANAPKGKSRTGWIIAGAIIVFILGLSIGLATRNNGEESTAATAAAVPEPSAPIDDTTVTTAADLGPSETRPDVFLDVDEAVVGAEPDSISVSSDNVDSDTTISFEPELEVNVGDSSLLNTHLPDLIASPTPPPSSSPTSDPVLSESINNAIPNSTMNPPSPSATPSKKPTRDPSAAPSKKPTSDPTKSPSDKPTSEPTKSPTPRPTKSPVVQLDLSGWANFNWSGETPAPSESPSQSLTYDPSTSPSKLPTIEPTSIPSKSPTVLPTSGPTESPTQSPTTAAPTESPTPNSPYFMGDEFYTFEEDGVSLDVSKGLTVRLIAKTGSKVKLANGDESKDRWHTRTDAAGVISMNPNDPLNSGYAYLSNSEEGDGDGGVYGLYFDQYGNIIDYKQLLKGTTDNCGGGMTPWNTWVSCEEFSDGQCWQIDPYSGQAKETKLGGSGGRYESVAVDNRNPENPVFFTTEDDEEGALRRFVAQGSGWDALHSGGEHSFLNIRSDNTFEWTDDLDVGRKSASKYFPNTEGIQVHEGKVYFMAKKIHRLLILDLETNTYETERTGKKFYGEGSFGDQPDQNMFGPTRKYIYFTEDGGKNPGVYARYGTDETYFTMFQGNLDEEDETTGIALSPDNTRFYAAIQGIGYVYEFKREDGLPFE